jgi:hypothetical protein
MAGLAGLGIGGAVGGIVGALVGMGIPEYEAKRGGEKSLLSGRLICWLAKDLRRSFAPNPN